MGELVSYGLRMILTQDANSISVTLSVNATLDFVRPTEGVERSWVHENHHARSYPTVGTPRLVHLIFQLSHV